MKIGLHIVKTGVDNTRMKFIVTAETIHSMFIILISMNVKLQHPITCFVCSLSPIRYLHEAKISLRHQKMAGTCLRAA